MFATILHYSIIALEVIFAFGLVIFFHELGHFIVAKWNGVAAPEFALGMGPEIAGFDWNGTRYKLCLFPIGGYVRMVGEDDDEEMETTHPPEVNFRNKHPLRKISIIFAGPFMNYILAVVLFAIVFMIWGIPQESLLPPESQSQRVSVLLTDISKPAYRGGIRDNDTILSVAGKEVLGFEDFQEVVRKNSGNEIEIVVKRHSGTETFTVVPKYNKIEKYGEIGVNLTHPEPREIESVKPGSPAAKAGLKTGDIILDFDKNTFWGDTYSLAGETAELLVYRGEGAEPETVVVTGTAGSALGAPLVPLNVRLGLFSAVSLGNRHCIRIISLTFKALWGMINKKISADEVSGPVGIVRYAAAFAKKGLKDFIHFFGVISISLAIINLFPIPALDGSRIVFHTWEAIIRRQLDPKREALIHYVGFCLLMALIIFITYRDIRKLLGF